VDWGGAGPGYVESEFPAFPYAVALLQGVFGPSEAWGRLLAALLSTLTVYLLYRLARDAFGDERAAVSAAFVFAVLPLSVYYGRAFMPEAAMLCASVAAIHAFDRWTATGARRWYLLAAGATSMACLLKLPCVYLGLPLLYLAWRTWGRGLVRRRSLAFAAIVLAPVVLWYTHAHASTDMAASRSASGVRLRQVGNWRLVGAASSGTASFCDLAERHLTWAEFPAGSGSSCRGQDDAPGSWTPGLRSPSCDRGRGNYVHDTTSFLPAAAFRFVMGRAISACSRRAALARLRAPWPRS
jgi:4-amino-4-deoxy-L-arabinose transferase-like glycosyltransferase